MGIDGNAFMYSGVRRVVYGKNSEYEDATFVPICTNCGRFVKADNTMRFQGDTVAKGPNSTCANCGRVEMLFEGFL